MRIDDFTFCLFVDNALSHEDMQKVEKQLIEVNEADATLHASMLSYTLNKDLADEMLGIEKNVDQKARNVEEQDSRILNTESLTQKSTTMNNKLSKEEILKVQELVVKFNESYDGQLSLKENLVNFYLTQRPGAFPEDAYSITSGLESGIVSFNANLKKALENGEFDYAAELREIALEMPLNEKYQLYMNFLAALQTLCVENLSAEQTSQLEGIQTIQKPLIVEGNVTEDMLHELEDKIGQLLKNNNLCLGSVENLKELMEELPNGTEAVENIVADSEQDVREKMIASMATYIAYQNEELESLEGQELSPEVIAISVAAGVEEMHVMDDLKSGRTTVDKAIMILKIIGGIALFSLLVYVALFEVAIIAGVTLAVFYKVFGASLIVTIVACALSLVAGLGAMKIMEKVGEAIMDFSSRTFDLLVDTWRKLAWPAIKNAVCVTWQYIAQYYKRQNTETLSPVIVH